jgi:hypothetical protein
MAGKLIAARGHDLAAVVMWVTGGKAGPAFFSAKGDGRGEEGMLDAVDGPRSLIARDGRHDHGVEVGSKSPGGPRS